MTLVGHGNLKYAVMDINTYTLKSAGATLENYGAGESIFLENDTPKFYYQIIKGKLKLNNDNGRGKEVLHKILEKGESVCVSALFLEEKYLVNAVAMRPCTIIKLCRPAFIDLLIENPEINMEIHKRISTFLHFKHVMGQIIYTQNPMVKLLGLLNYLKLIHHEKEPFAFQVPFTRQEIANMTGLCVETTIRTVKIMERKKIVKIRNRKILY